MMTQIPAYHADVIEPCNNGLGLMYDDELDFNTVLLLRHQSDNFADWLCVGPVHYRYAVYECDTCRSPLTSDHEIDLGFAYEGDSYYVTVGDHMAMTAKYVSLVTLLQLELERLWALNEDAKYL